MTFGVFESIIYEILLENVILLYKVYIFLNPKKHTCSTHGVFGKHIKNSFKEIRKVLDTCEIFS